MIIVEQRERASLADHVLLCCLHSFSSGCFVLQVSQFVASAEAQLKSGDYAAAVRTVDAGMRLDAGNRDLQAVLDRAKPRHEASERSRRSGLSTTELLKEKGDDFYKKASFEVSSDHPLPTSPPRARAALAVDGAIPVEFVFVPRFLYVNASACFCCFAVM